MSFTHLLLASGCRHLLGVLTHLLGNYSDMASKSYVDRAKPTSGQFPQVWLEVTRRFVVTKKAPFSAGGTT